MMLFLINRVLELGLEHLLLLSSSVATKLYTDLEFEKAFDVEIFFQTHNEKWNGFINLYL